LTANPISAPTLVVVGEAIVSATYRACTCVASETVCRHAIAYKERNPLLWGTFEAGELLLKPSVLLGRQLERSVRRSDEFSEGPAGLWVHPIVVSKPGGQASAELRECVDALLKRMNVTVG
jgi:hypothetical protein